jgi:hypothetical protein
MVIASVVLMVLFAQGVSEVNAIGVLAIMNLISTVIIWKLMNHDFNVLIKRILK